MCRKRDTVQYFSTVSMGPGLNWEEGSCFIHQGGHGARKEMSYRYEVTHTSLCLVVRFWSMTDQNYDGSLIRCYHPETLHPSQFV